MPTEMQRAVGLFRNRQSAETALAQLRDSSFDMNKVSIVNKDSKTGEMQGAKVNADRDSDDNQVADSAGRAAAVGGVSGGAIGLIGSLGILAIPGVGPVAELGVLLANTVFAGAIGAAGSGLVGALVGWGLPEDQAQYYSDRVDKSGDYLVIVEGDATSIRTAENILQNNHINDWRTFSATNTAPSTASSNAGTSARGTSTTGTGVYSDSPASPASGRTIL
ncbi:MAG: hypothetical protein HLUCCA11_06100 [Phormidesmis priestleyi Ana]|uniref:Uncharacterized protein n=1 Tax=Phormidesmis priestleyi Ana TaxID=1666911 RepID=A0A0P7Z0B8_9CYAN|nr:MAG: hypothetical protein HLUCCA11_06100 [Phormidesmis priestleyi Ana]